MESTTGPVPGGTFLLAGRPIPRMGYGLGQLARRTAADGDRARAVALLREAYELGVRHLDTAQFYANGLANELIADALSDVRDEIMIATKAGARPVPGAQIPLTAAQRPEELRAAVEANLQTLRTDRLDLVNLRRMDLLPGLLAEGDQIVPIDDQLVELISLRDQGKIIAIGLSQVSLDQVESALDGGIACVQNIYHLLGREGEPLLDFCRDRQLAWIPYYPLGSGSAIFPVPKVTDDPVVQAVAEETGATPSQVGLAWQLAHAENTMLIPGTGNRDHLIENTAAGDLRLDPDQLRRLDDAGRETVPQ